MKKTGFIAALAVMALLAVILVGCGSRLTMTYANEKQYSAGSGEVPASVRELDVDWSSGAVRVETYAGSTVRIAEHSSRSLPEELQVHWWLDGATLRIRFCASGQRLSLPDTAKKELTVSLPQELALESLTVDTAAADVTVAEAYADVLRVSTASRDMELSCAAKQIELNSASGSMALLASGSCESLAAHSASGRIKAELDSVEMLKCGSASGSIEIDAAAADFVYAESTSGKIVLALDKLAHEGKVDSTSGKVTLQLPQDAGFTAKIRSNSGELHSDFAMKYDGESYVCGDGRTMLTIETTSGDIALRSR